MGGQSTSPSRGLPGATGGTAGSWLLFLPRDAVGQREEGGGPEGRAGWAVQGSPGSKARDLARIRNPLPVTLGCGRSTQSAVLVLLPSLHPKAPDAGLGLGLGPAPPGAPGSHLCWGPLHGFSPPSTRPRGAAPVASCGRPGQWTKEGSIGECVGRPLLTPRSPSLGPGGEEEPQPSSRGPCGTRPWCGSPGEPGLSFGLARGWGGGLGAAQPGRVY